MRRIEEPRKLVAKQRLQSCVAIFYAVNKTSHATHFAYCRGCGKIRNDYELDNLVETNILRYREDKRIKDLVIWHKRLFEKGESRIDYDHFLEWQFGVIMDELDGTLFEVVLSKSDYRDKTADHAQAMGAVSAQPTSQMDNLQMKTVDSKVLGERERVTKRRAEMVFRGASTRKR